MIKSSIASPFADPRANRTLPFTARVAKHEDATPKCAPPTLKKRVGALQALLTYAFQQRWTLTNTGSGIRIVGYTKRSYAAYVEVRYDITDRMTLITRLASK